MCTYVPMYCEVVENITCSTSVTRLGNIGQEPSPGPLSKKATSLASKRHRHSFITHNTTYAYHVLIMTTKPFVCASFPKFTARSERPGFTESMAPTSSGQHNPPSPQEAHDVFLGAFDHDTHTHMRPYMARSSMTSKNNKPPRNQSARTAICQTCRIPCSSLGDVFDLTA